MKQDNNAAETAGSRILRNCCTSQSIIMAFSLAEVLITLGIIGVIATITIPMLIGNIEYSKNTTAYKSAYSTLSSALSSASLDNALTPANNSTTFTNNFLEIMKKFKVVKQCTSGTNNSECWNQTGEKYIGAYPVASSYAFIDASGRSWSMYYSLCSAVFVDTNGFKGPNQWGQDRFVFRVIDSKNQSETNMDIPIKVLPIGNNPSQLCTPELNHKCSKNGDYNGTKRLYE